MIPAALFSRFPRLLASLVLLAASAGIALAATPVKVGLTAEYSLAGSTSAQAIELGLKAAILEINGRGGVLGRPLELVSRDNRGIPARALVDLREMAAMPELVAVFGGKFSPVMLELAPQAAKLKLPLLATWSAANGITDVPGWAPWVFRLSLRDDWAMRVLLNDLRQRHGVRRVGVMLPNTAWGRSCQAALMDRERSQPGTGDATLSFAWYNWGETSMLDYYQRLLRDGAEGLLLVANEQEAAILVKELAQLPAGSRRLPIASHWGISGGDFVALTQGRVLEQDMSVVQTFTFNDPPTPRRRAVLTLLRQQLGVAEPERLLSQVGFAQAYDFMHLLALAIERAGAADRARIRAALERLPALDGLIRRYAPAFTAERHEALREADVFLARYRPDGTLARLPAGQSGR